MVHWALSPSAHKTDEAEEVAAVAEAAGEEAAGGEAAGGEEGGMRRGLWCALPSRRSTGCETLLGSAVCDGVTSPSSYRSDFKTVFSDKWFFD